MRKLLYNATTANEGRSLKGYLLIDGDIIAQVGEGDVPVELLACADSAEDLEGI